MTDRHAVCATLLRSLCQSSIPTCDEFLADETPERWERVREAAAAIEAVAWDVEQEEQGEKDAQH